MRDIGVVAALPGEAQAWNAPDAGERVHVAVSGIGARRAAATATRLLAGGATALVSWGVAGGLADALHPGDLVLAERIGSDAGSEVPSPAWNRALRAALAEMAVDVLPGRLWSHAGLVASTSEKRRLAARGHDIVDMEAAAVAHVAREAGVPFVAVKCVCDPASRAVPASASRLLQADGRVRAAALVPMLVRPRAWRALRRMRDDFDAARAGLRRAAPAVVASCPA